MRDSQHPYGIILQRGNHSEEKTKHIGMWNRLDIHENIVRSFALFFFPFFMNRTLTQVRSTGEMKLHDAKHWMENIVVRNAEEYCYEDIISDIIGWMKDELCLCIKYSS